MEIPSPNDSLKASLSPPVAGCHCSFRRDWQTNKCSNNVLNITTNVYVLPFISRPKLARVHLIHSEYKALQKDQALAACIQSLLSKNAIERMENVKSLGFYSRLFQILKPHQRWRPNQAQHLSTCRKVQNRNSRVHQGFLIPGEWGGPRWQSGNTLASHLCGWGSIPVMAVSGKAGSCLPLVGSLQYRTLANYMYWFPLPFQLPVVI